MLSKVMFIVNIIINPIVLIIGVIKWGVSGIPFEERSIIMLSAVTTGSLLYMYTKYKKLKEGE